MNEPAPIEIHKALADDTRYRLYRYLRLSGRPVPVRELATRLSLHANTIRPHLRRLVDAGLVASETRREPSAVGRPQTVYTVVTSNERDGRDYRLLADILATLISGTRARTGAHALAREWGDFLVTRHAPPPGARRPGAEPRGPSRSARRGRVRPPVPAQGHPDRRDRTPRLPVPRSPRGAPGAGVHGAPRSARGDAGRLATPAAAALARTARGPGLCLSRRRRHLTLAPPGRWR